jgi:hypothetical protein
LTKATYSWGGTKVTYSWGGAKVTYSWGGAKVTYSWGGENLLHYLETVDFNSLINCYCYIVNYVINLF